jgi:hypothetical protein
MLFTAVLVEVEPPNGIFSVRHMYLRAKMPPDAARAQPFGCALVIVSLLLN